MPFHVMIKPVGARCNLNCEYCFFLSKGETLGSRAQMEPELLEEFTRQYIEAQPPGPVVFTWQGGEPTLAGLDFFKRALSLQEKYAIPEKIIANDLQTNGQLIDEKWCRFLKDNKFLIGLSLDGPRDEHDRYRQTPQGSSSFDKTLNAARLFKQYEIPFNTLTVVNRHNVKEPEKLYYFLRDEAKSTFMQFLPLVEPKDHVHTPPGFWHPDSLAYVDEPEAASGHENSYAADFSVEPKDWGRFLITIFDLWRNGDVGQVYIPIFESLLAVWSGQPASLCVFAEKCGRNLALDSDGSVYFCDRFCYRDYKLGHLSQGLGNLLQSVEHIRWGMMKKAVAKACRSCRWLFACQGECPKNRFIRDRAGNMGLNYLCRGWQMFFEHIDPHLSAMAEYLRNHEQIQTKE